MEEQRLFNSQIQIQNLQSQGSLALEENYYQIYFASNSKICFFFNGETDFLLVP